MVNTNNNIKIDNACSHPHNQHSTQTEVYHEFLSSYSSIDTYLAVQNNNMLFTMATVEGLKRVNTFFLDEDPIPSMQPL